MPKALDAAQYEIVESAAPAAPAKLGPKPLALEEVEVLPSYANGLAPESPINKSPVSVEDRLKLTAGNTSGKIKYLKNKYEDARADKHGNLLVKDQGLWHAVDPSGLGDGDAWERTKELAKDFGDLADVALSGVGSGLGAAGGLVAGPAGSAVGAGVGGGAAEVARTSLGRLVGTYEATPEQQAKDIAWEAVLNAGGQTVALGVKPGFNMLKSSFEKWGTRASNFAKENMADLWARATGQARWAMRRGMDAADSVFPKAQKALEEIGPAVSPTEALDVVQRQQTNILKTFAGKADGALKAEYAQGLKDVLGAIPENFSANAEELIGGTFKQLADEGYGKFVAGSSGKAIKFQLLSPEDVAKRLGTAAADVPKVIGEKTRGALEEVVSTLNQYSSIKTLSGKNGAKKLIELRRAVNESLGDLLDSEAPDSVKRVVAQVKDGFGNRVSQSFGKHSPEAAQLYAVMNDNFSKKVDAVKYLKRAMDSKDPGAVDGLVKKFVSKAGSNRTLKDETKMLADLLGENGHKMMNDLVDWEASKAFYDFVPKEGGDSLSQALKFVGKFTGQSNPRMVGKQIQYLSQVQGFFKNMGPAQLDAFMKNDQAVGDFVRTAVATYDGEDQQIQQLLQEAGVQ